MNFLNDLWLRANNNPSCPNVTYSNIFLCAESFYPLLLSRIHTHKLQCKRFRLFSFCFFLCFCVFPSLQVTLNTFRHISGTHNMKQKENNTFFSLFSYPFHNFPSSSFACDDICWLAERTNVKKHTRQPTTRHDRWKCGESFS